MLLFFFLFPLAYARYAELGAHVALVALDRDDELHAVAAEAGARGAASAAAVVGDLSGRDDAALAATVEAVLALEAFDGQLDVLVLNHAVQPGEGESREQKVQQEQPFARKSSCCQGQAAPARYLRCPVPSFEHAHARTHNEQQKVAYFFINTFDVCAANLGWGWLLPSPAGLRAWPSGRAGGLNDGAGWSWGGLDAHVGVNFVSYAKLVTLAMPALVKAADEQQAGAAEAAEADAEEGLTTPARKDAAAAEDETTAGASLVPALEDPASGLPSDALSDTRPAQVDRAVAEPRLVRSQVVVVASGAGLLPSAQGAVDSAAKHALVGFFDSLRLELEHKRLPVSVTTVVLGRVATAQALGAQPRGGGGVGGWATAPPRSQAAAAVVRAGAAGLEQAYWPPSQLLGVAAALRGFPGFRYALDRLNLLWSGGQHE